MAVTQSQAIDFKQIELRSSYDVAANTKVYRNTFLGEDGSGNAGSYLTGGTYTRFIGVSLEEVDNTDANSRSGTSAAGDKQVVVASRGRMKFPISGVTKAHVGDAVYASDNFTLTLTAGSHEKIGIVHEVHTAGTAIVYFLGFQTEMTA